MRCDVLLFAQIAEELGTDRMLLELTDGCCVADLLRHLSSEHPTFAAWSDRTAVAVNESYVTRDHPLQDGDTIALIPPVSGG